MDVFVDSNGSRTTPKSLNAAVICTDVLQACGYSLTGVAREFRDFPSYRVVRVVGKQQPVSVVDLTHVVDWLRSKAKKFRTKEKFKNGNHVFAIFARIWLDVLAMGREDVPEETAIRGLMKANIPVLIPSDESEDSVIYRPFEDADFSRLVESKILEVYRPFEEVSCLVESKIPDVWDGIMTNLNAIKNELYQFNTEVTERKMQFQKRIELLRNTLAEVESLIT